MAFADFVRTVKNKASQMYSNFFYEGKDVPSTPRKGRVFAGQEPTPPQQPPEQQFQQYQQPVQQQYYGSGYQQPYQPGQPYQQPQPQYTPQPEQPQRARRAAQHASNVVQVDFGSQQPEVPVQEPAAQQPAALLSARIINARGMSDCRSAITLLRNGDAVLIVMENITNPGDMRRLVDTLSGACYSLTATITKGHQSDERGSCPAAGAFLPGESRLRCPAAHDVYKPHTAARPAACAAAAALWPAPGFYPAHSCAGASSSELLSASLDAGFRDPFLLQPSRRRRLCA